MNNSAVKRVLHGNIRGCKIYPGLEDLTITPSLTEQTYNHPNSYGYDNIKINPISNEYVKPEGTKEITKNGEHDVKNYEKVNINIVGGYDLKVEDTTVIFINGATINGSEVIL